MRVWFTSDTHFGHSAMAATGKGWRPFATVQEHDEFLIERWNSVVRPNDEVWHLGDVGLGPTELILSTVARLHGTKHLVAGNHDACWPGNRDAHRVQRRWLTVFESVAAFARRRTGRGQYVLLSHFPYRGDHSAEDRYAEYRLQDTGMWLLHGHVHGEWARRGRQINVGVDVRDWQPIELCDVAAMIRERDDAVGQQSPRR